MAWTPTYSRDTLSFSSQMLRSASCAIMTQIMAQLPRSRTGSEQCIALLNNASLFLCSASLLLDVCTWYLLNTAGRKQPHPNYYVVLVHLPVIPRQPRCSPAIGEGARTVASLAQWSLCHARQRPACRRTQAGRLESRWVYVPACTGVNLHRARSVFAKVGSHVHML